MWFHVGENSLKVEGVLPGTTVADLKKSLSAQFPPTNDFSHPTTFDLVLPGDVQWHGHSGKLPIKEALDNKFFEIFDSEGKQEIVVTSIGAPAPPTTETFNPEKWLQQFITKQKTDKIQSLTQEEVTTAQKANLGPFFLKPLPHGIHPNGLDLEFLGFATDTKAVQTAVNDISLDKHVALIARSGSGKTGTIVGLAKRFFLIYICAMGAKGGQLSSQFQRDNNSLKLEQDLYYALTNPQLVTQVEPERTRKIFELVSNRTRHEIIGRLLFLVILLKQNSSLTPEQFFREQISDKGRSLIQDFIQISNQINESFIGSTISTIKKSIENTLQERSFANHKLVWALDEAQLYIHPEIWHLRASLLAAREYRTPQSGVPNEDKRFGFLTPFCSEISLHGVIVVSGASLTLSNNAEQVYSAIGKQEILDVVFDFGNCENPYQTLSQFLNLEGIKLDDIKPELESLRGRFRLAMSVICKIWQCQKAGNDKTQLFKNSVHLALERVVAQIAEKITQNLSSKPELKEKFEEILLQWTLKGRKIVTKQLDGIDLISVLCTLTTDRKKFLFDEGFVFEAIEKALRKSAGLIMFKELKKSYQDEQHGSQTGVTLEGLVPLTLIGFDQKVTVAELPFVKKFFTSEKLPDWCSRVQVRTHETGTADKWGFSADAQGDLDFFKQPVEQRIGKILKPNHATRPDFVCFLDDCHAMVISVAVCTTCSAVKNEKTKNDFDTTYWKNWFLSRELTTYGVVKGLNTSLLALNPFKGILRIHVLIPKGSPHSFCQSKVQIMKDEAGKITEEDVIVFIQEAELELLFCTDPTLNKFSVQNKTVLEELRKIIKKAQKNEGESKRKKSKRGKAKPKEKKKVMKISK